MNKAEIIEEIIRLTISENWQGRTAEQERIDAKKEFSKLLKADLVEMLSNLEEAQEDYINQLYH